MQYLTSSALVTCVTTCILAKRTLDVTRPSEQFQGDGEDLD
jgi:hypothetical protein